MNAVLSREPTAVTTALASELAHLLPLALPIIIRRGVGALEREPVPAGEKLVSLFEEPTRVVHKDGRDTYYGHKSSPPALRHSPSAAAKRSILDRN